jgi:hypothetical protein
MKNTINTYFAVLLVTIAGAGAAILIVHIATSNPTTVNTGNNEASYAPLQNSILNSK